MKRGRLHRVEIICFSLILLFTIAFIFHNSMQSGPESNAWSTRIAEFLQSIIDWDDRLNLDDFHKFVRKLAHFLEFALLGCVLYMLNAILPLRIRTLSVCDPLFLALFCAVTDEFIQSFTGRTSSVRDVLIDFSGAVVGILVGTAARKLKHRFQNRRSVSPRE